jgi:hypothetical protein
LPATTQEGVIYDKKLDRRSTYAVRICPWQAVTLPWIPGTFIVEAGFLDTSNNPDEGLWKMKNSLL